MLKPLDVVARALAIPSIAWSASNALLNVRRMWTDDSPSGLRARLQDGFFERTEERCRARWIETFVTSAPETDDEQNAA